MGFMKPSVIERWHEFLDGGHSADALQPLLAEDCVFLSPAVFSPQQGRAKTTAYLVAAAKMFEGNGFRYLEEWIGERSAVLEFAATIDGMYVNGVDLIHWNASDEIVSFKVMMRPFKGLQVIMPKMAELLRSA